MWTASRLLLVAASTASLYGATSAKQHQKTFSADGKDLVILLSYLRDRATLKWGEGYVQQAAERDGKSAWILNKNLVP